MPSEKSPWTHYLISFLAIAGWTGFAKIFFPQIELVNLAMIYLVINVIIAVRYGFGSSIFAAILSVACFNFFFVPPYFTFAIADIKYLVTFLIMISVTPLTSRLTIQLRKSAEAANERAILAEEARAAKIEAEREGIISSLLSSVSHDLRTPLTSISGAAGTLLAEDQKLSLEDRQRLLESINEESIRLNRLVENILQITKIETGNITVHKQQNSLEEIIGSALNRLDAQLRGRPITIDIPEDLPLIPLDDLLAEQVFINLLENASRYTPAGSPINIRTFLEPKRVCVEISDRGLGVSPEDRERIFEKFYRSGKKDIWGSGLGLAICRGIMKAHRGDIGIRDNEGGGSVFYFSLPLEEGRKEI